MSFFPPEHPYPPDRYTGTDGEVNARFRPSDTPSELSHANGGCDYLAVGTQTRGDYGLYRWTMGPKPSGPDPHFHKSLSESFFVLSGTIRLFDGTQWIDARPGDFLYVPEGGVHGFRNESDAAAAMLILFAPGAPRERYFEELAEIAASGRELSREEWAELYSRHDQTMV